MKIKDLMASLSHHDPEMEVAIFDTKGNLLAGDDDPSLGVYPIFLIEKMTKEDVPEGTPEWIALSFNSDFFDDAIFDPLEEKKCRICGCTDNDCRQCIEKTGSPCSWVADDLCSACV